MLKKAIFSALSKKLTDGELKIIDSLSLQEAKTKLLNSTLKSFFNTKIAPSTLLVAANENKLINRAAKNIEKVKTVAPNSIGVYDLLTHKNVVIEEKALADIK